MCISKNCRECELLHLGTRVPEMNICRWPRMVDEFFWFVLGWMSFRFWGLGNFAGVGRRLLEGIYIYIFFFFF